MAISDKLLKTFKLRHTPGREAILLLFLKRNYALSHADIEKEVEDTLDRVTVYRTLKTFLSRGLIHKVLDNQGSLKYALCSENCTSVHHQHEHIHFKCSKCEQTSCLDVEIPPVKLPKGFKPEEMNLLVQGICDQCSSKK